MGSRIKVGRPKGSSFVISLIQTKILQYKKRYKTTSWNAWTRLTKTKHFKELIKEFYARRNNKSYYIKRMLENKETQNKFYKNNIIKDRSGIASLVKTPSKDYIRYKK
tara:strand:+ start:60 stop:383 length:324 start_codon:yes stop_codon:yes gene_type:complete